MLSAPTATGKTRETPQARRGHIESHWARDLDRPMGRPDQKRSVHHVGNVGQNALAATDLLGRAYLLVPIRLG
jgi:hypothetical protein